MANVSENLYAWSNTGSSNQPDSGDAPTVQADLQAIQAGVRGWLAHKGSDIASATTTDIGAVEGLYHDITGTTTITGLGTVSAGIWKMLQFDGALTLTHNASSLILPGGANITTAAGDQGIFLSLGSGNWTCVSYFRAANSPTQDASATVKGVVELATQAEVDTGTDAARVVTADTLFDRATFKTILASGSLPSANAVAITDIPQTYVALLLVVFAASYDTATRTAFVQTSTDNGSSYDTTASNYQGNKIRDGTASAIASATLIEGTAQDAGNSQTLSCIIMGYQSGGVTTSYGVSLENAGGTTTTSSNFVIKSASTDAVDAIRIIINSTGNFDAGTYALYGLK